jgi:hypothetical protein
LQKTYEKKTRLFLSVNCFYGLAVVDDDVYACDNHIPAECFARSAGSYVRYYGQGNIQKRCVDGMRRRHIGDVKDKGLLRSSLVTGM